jgi:hypothetical protein
MELLHSHVVVPTEYAFNKNEKYSLDGKSIVSFKLENVGTAAVTLFDQTVLQSGDVWCHPSNNLGLLFGGELAVKFADTGTKKLMLYALVLKES